MKKIVSFFAAIVLSGFFATMSCAQDTCYYTVVPSGQTIYFYLRAWDNNSIHITNPNNVNRHTYPIQTPWDGYTKPTGNLVIPDSISVHGVKYPVTRIGWYAFYGCTGLTSITIPEGIEEIEIFAFQNCTSLQSITIPSSISTIWKGAFKGCSALSSTSYTGTVEQWFGIDFDYVGSLDFIFSDEVDGNPIRYSRNLYINDSLLTTLTIPDGDTIVNSNFRYDTAITSIVLPSSVQTIGSSAFQNCSGLPSINIPSSVQIIGNSAFQGCSRLDSINIPSSVYSIGSKAFLGCTNLRKIKINSSTPPTLVTNSVTVGNSTYNQIGFRTTTFIQIPCGTFNTYYNAWGGGSNQTVIYDNASGNWSYWYIIMRGMLYENEINFDANSNDTVMGLAGVWSHGSWFTTDYAPHPARCSDSIVFARAFPNEHYHFVQWSNGDTAILDTLRLQGDSTITAIFAPNQYTITLQSADASIGTVDGGGTSDYHSILILSATPVTGYHFVYWNDGNTENPRHYLIEGDDTLTAFFAIDTHTVAVTVNNIARGSVTSSGTEFTYGQPCTVEATAYTGYTFHHWSNGVTANPYTFAVMEDVSLTAIFLAPGEETYTVTVNSNDPTMGSATVNGNASVTVISGESVTLTATPNDGYHFVRWNDNNTEATRTVTITADMSFTAYFEADGTQGISDALDTDIKVYVENRRIHVIFGNQTIEEVGIYDIVGRKVDGGYKPHFDVPNSGVYIVRIGNQTARKVVVIR